ncbi:MAG: nitroreductase family protein [Flavobacteriales bacterium]|nr:nitroreductase family protein [Flavobacteriales bacterium]
MNITDHIKNRWSPRSFTEEQVTEDQLNRIFEAARWAASGNNGQPWRFIYGRKGTEAFKNIFDALMEGNQTWAKNASVLIAVVGRTRHEYKERANRQWMYDVGLAVGNLSIQATAEGLHLHQMGGVHFDVLDKNIGVVEPFESIAVIALGHKGSPDLLPEPLAERETAERTRKELSDIVFEGQFPG